MSSLSAETIQQLQFANSINKRLDEHRELVESIESSTSLFAQKPWHVNHMATQDDFLMRLFYMTYGCWPDDSNLKKIMLTGMAVRKRPPVLGACSLPEYEAE